MPTPAPRREGVTVLAAGDHFVLSSLLADAVREQAPDAEIRELTLPWSHEPFGRVAEVDEASGSEDELIAALAGVQICVTEMAPFTEKVLDACPDLRLVCVSRGGPVNVNIDAATRNGVAVTSAPGRNAAATAEHSVALILAAVRHIPDAHDELRTGRWRGDYYAYENCGFEIDGATVGIVGCGAIGSRVARAMAALGATVVFHDPYVPDDLLPGVATKVDLAELLETSQVVTLHARVTDETRGMIGRAEIEAMPHGSVFVNCARGALMYYEPVYDALRTGHLFGAAFDVFDPEPPPPDSPLRDLPNVVITPHIAGASRQTAEKAARIVAADVGCFLRGEPLAHCANPGVLDAHSG